MSKLFLTITLIFLVSILSTNCSLTDKGSLLTTQASKVKVEGEAFLIDDTYEEHSKEEVEFLRGMKITIVSREDWIAQLNDKASRPDLERAFETLNSELDKTDKTPAEYNDFLYAKASVYNHLLPYRNKLETSTDSKGRFEFAISRRTYILFAEHFENKRTRLRQRLWILHFDANEEKIRLVLSPGNEIVPTKAAICLMAEELCVPK